jgi:hypothetical protein
VTVPANAVDPDGDPLVLTVLDNPAPVRVEVEGSSFVITAPQGADGVTVVRYSATDPFGASATAFLRITVTQPPPTSTTTTTNTTTTTTTTIAPDGLLGA